MNLSFVFFNPWLPFWRLLLSVIRRHYQVQLLHEPVKGEGIEVDFGLFPCYILAAEELATKDLFPELNL